MEQRFDATLGAHVDIGEQGRADGIIVPAVVGGVLEAPDDLARVGAEGDGGGGPLVVAFADLAVPGGGVAGVPVEQVEVRVIGSGGPGGGAAVLPGVAGPGFI